MKILTRLGAGAAVAALGAATAVAGLAVSATAAPVPGHFHIGRPAAGSTVFVQTDNLAGNQVVAYTRDPGGALTFDHAYNTGGLGGELSGSVVDHLASEGSLTYDPAAGLLYAVNAGSNTVSVFSVQGDRLALRQIVPSGGTFPVSVAVHGDLVAVLNATNGGSVQEFAQVFGRLIPVPGSNRALGLDPTATPQFTTTPGQVTFSPDGSQLIVTTKDNGNDIDVFGVNLFGQLSSKPVVNPEPAGSIPFGVIFNGQQQLVVSLSGTNSVATFSLNRNGTVTSIDTLATGQSATCWVTEARGFVFASNPGTSNLSGVQAEPDGHLTLVGTTATDAGTVDAASIGHDLYVQTGGSGIVDAFHVGANGSLSPIGSVTVPGAVGGEGIVAI